MKFSMIQAAKEIGVSKSTMHRYVDSGRVSATKLDTGGYEIDASELVRAFPDGWKRKDGTGSKTLSRDEAEPHGTGTETPFESGALRAEVKMLREMLARMDVERDQERRAASDAIEDYRTRLDQEAAERRALNARLLTYQRPPEAMTPLPPATSDQQPKRGGLFGFFKRAG